MSSDNNPWNVVGFPTTVKGQGLAEAFTTQGDRYLPDNLAGFRIYSTEREVVPPPSYLYYEEGQRFPETGAPKEEQQTWKITDITPNVGQVRVLNKPTSRSVRGLADGTPLGPQHEDLGHIPSVFGRPQFLYDFPSNVPQPSMARSEEERRGQLYGLQNGAAGTNEERLAIARERRRQEVENYIGSLPPEQRIMYRRLHGIPDPAVRGGLRGGGADGGDPAAPGGDGDRKDDDPDAGGGAAGMAAAIADAIPEDPIADAEGNFLAPEKVGAMFTYMHALEAARQRMVDMAQASGVLRQQLLAEANHGGTALGTRGTGLTVAEMVQNLGMVPEQDMKMVDESEVFADSSLQRNNRYMFVKEGGIGPKDMRFRYLRENMFLVHAMTESGASPARLDELIASDSLLDTSVFTLKGMTGIESYYDLFDRGPLHGQDFNWTTGISKGKPRAPFQIHDDEYVKGMLPYYQTGATSAYDDLSATLFGIAEPMMADYPGATNSRDYAADYKIDVNDSIDLMLRHRMSSVLLGALVAADLKPGKQELTEKQTSAFISSVFRLGEAAMKDVEQQLSLEGFGNDRGKMLQDKFDAFTTFGITLSELATAALQQFTLGQIRKGRNIEVSRQEIRQATNNLMATFTDFNTQIVDPTIRQTHSATWSLLQAAVLQASELTDDLWQEMIDNADLANYFSGILQGDVEFTYIDNMLDNDKLPVMKFMRKLLERVARSANVPNADKRYVKALKLFDQYIAVREDVDSGQPIKGIINRKMDETDEQYSFATAVEAFRQTLLLAGLDGLKNGGAMVTRHSETTQMIYKALRIRSMVTAMSMMPTYQASQSEAQTLIRGGLVGTGLPINTEPNLGNSKAEQALSEDQYSYENQLRWMAFKTSSLAYRMSKVPMLSGTEHNRMERDMYRSGDDFGAQSRNFIAGAWKVYTGEGKEDMITNQMRGTNQVLRSQIAMMNTQAERGDQRNNRNSLENAFQATFYPRPGIGGEMNPFASWDNFQNNARALVGLRLHVDQDPAEQAARLSRWAEANQGTVVGYVTNQIGPSNMVEVMKLVKNAKYVIAGLSLTSATISAGLLLYASANLAWNAMHKFGPSADIIGSVREYFTENSKSTLMSDLELTKLSAQTMLLSGTPLSAPNAKFVSEVLDLVPAAAFKELELQHKEVTKRILGQDDNIKNIMKGVMEEAAKLKEGENFASVTFQLTGQIIHNLGLAETKEIRESIMDAVGNFLGVYTVAGSVSYIKAQGVSLLHDTLYAVYINAQNTVMKEAFMAEKASATS